MYPFLPPVVSVTSDYQKIDLTAYCTPYPNIEISSIKIEKYKVGGTFPQELYMYYFTNLERKFKVYAGTYNRTSVQDPYTEIRTYSYPYVSGATWYGGLSEETGEDLRKITITSIDETQSAYEDFKTWLTANATKIS